MSLHRVQPFTRKKSLRRSASKALMAVMVGASALYGTSSVAQTTPTAAPAAAADYVIGSGDVVRITVFQNPDLTLETRVSETGMVSYPLLGQVKIGGMTTRKAEAAIADGLQKGNFVRSPQVSLLVTQVRGNQASVLGQVNRPGRYPIEVSGMRLSQLLAAAGGATVSGSDIAVLTGMRNGRQVRTQVDVGDLFSGSRGAAVEDPVVQDGDTLYVDRMPMVYIHGEVQRPGSFRLERDMTITQALAAGGGLNAKGTLKGLRVHRRDTSGKVTVMEPKMTDSLQPGDVVFVQESLF